MKTSALISVLFAGAVAFGGVIEYKGGFPEMDADAFVALTNRVAAGETLLILSEKTPKELSWRTDGPDRLLAWPKDLRLAKEQGGRVSWRKIGRGLVIVAPESVDSPDFRANVEWHADLLKNHGFWYVGYSFDKPESPVIGITMRYAEKVIEPKRDKTGGAYWANYDADRTRKLRPLFRLEGKVTAGDGSSRYYETIEQPFGDTLVIRNVAVIRNVVHGRAKLEARFFDLEKNFSVLVDSRELVFPAYLETFLPNNGEVAVNRETADVTVGFRINDEPHFGQDFVKVTLFDPSNKPVFEKTFESSVGHVHYVTVPLPRDAAARSNWPLQFETTCGDGRVVCDKRRLRLNDDRRYDFIDQDGMLLSKSAQRSFRFGVDSSVTNFAGTKIVATWTFGESRAMTHVFAEQVRVARQAAGPIKPLAAQIALDRTSRDLASDRRAVKALAALAFAGGANAVDWDFSKCKTPLNPLASYAADAQAELLALGPAFAAAGRMVTSADGALYARVTEETLLVVNTERFEAHASTLKVPAFAGKTLQAPDGKAYAFDKEGRLSLTLEPDEVLALKRVP